VGILGKDRIFKILRGAQNKKFHKKQGAHIWQEAIVG
jgi:hypothetical protein